MIKLILILFVLFISGNCCIFRQEDDKIYTVVEQNPEFPEGQAALFKWLSQNLKYPKRVVDDGCGKMVVQFVIEKNGRARFESCKFLHCSLKCNEMKNVIKNMPRWKAGQQNGKPVRVLYTLSINIRWE
jgi:periplasmic protein TonB